jgi:ABC-2 type transport system permease protein
MPIVFILLFCYVSGGAIQGGTNDLQSGIFERFHSMPIARSSVAYRHKIA